MGTQSPPDNMDHNKLRSISSQDRHPGDSVFQGASAKMRLLLKLVQDYEDAARSGGASTLEKQPRSISGILCVLDDVKSGLERSHYLACRRDAELRRCKTDLRRGGGASSSGLHGRVERQQPETVLEENQRLRKELWESLTARKSLEKMFSSLGKEKEIMAAELARKAHDLHDIEEHLSDLKAQNEMLLEKVKLCAAEHKDKMSHGGPTPAHSPPVPTSENKFLQDRNKALSEQLLKAVDGYRYLKRKLQDAHEEKVVLQAKVVEMAGQAALGLERIREFCRRAARGNGSPAAAEGSEVEQEISSMEGMFRRLEANMLTAVDGGGKKMENSKPVVAVTEVIAGNTKPAVTA